MKKLFLSLILALFASAVSFAGVPQYFNYHGVVAEKNSQMAVIVTIIDISGDPGLTQTDHDAVYSETHVVNTNANGAFSLKIGSGTRAGSAKFEDIDFAKGSYGVKIIAGTHTSVFPLVSVPYALVAQDVPGFAEALKRITDLETKLKDYSTLVSDVAQLKTDNGGLKNRVGTLEGKADSLAKRVAALEAAAKFEDITVDGTTYKLGVSGAIDLGLSVKWATCNIGATAPGEYGDYYAWGETETKSTYDWSTYKWMAAGKSSWDYLTKYTCADGQTSASWYKDGTYVGTTVDGVTYTNKTKLDPEDDVAHVKLGGDWRMPTDAELTELRTKCTWKGTQYGGHNGYVVIGSTGNAIFLPAAGYRDDSSLEGAGSTGRYWSSSLGDYASYVAWYVNFFLGDVDFPGFVDMNYVRFCGLSVRPVCPQN